MQRDEGNWQFSSGNRETLSNGACAKLDHLRAGSCHTQDAFIGYHSSFTSIDNKSID
jgi:hypothetical protein